MEEWQTFNQLPTFADARRLTDVKKAMGICRPSMYAAFGNKEQLDSNGRT